ncbi:MAG: class I SAM-dependent methyltransferase [Candidatus Sumerlaeaceae bacterium]|nr:class I SAM-dependent methyltransferase [Candidatus Sumerlaeaceae bacterium]
MQQSQATKLVARKTQSADRTTHNALRFAMPCIGCAAMKIFDWLRGTRPASRLTILEPGTFTFEQGSEMPERLTAAFGELSQLTALNLGAGWGESYMGRQTLSLPWKRLISVEAFEPYIEKLAVQPCRAASHEIVHSRIEDYIADQSAPVADVALLIDVIEHFSKPAALQILARLGKVVSKGIVIFLPIGHFEQDEYDGNEMQRHLSEWSGEELAGLGYDTVVYPKFHGQVSPPPDAAWAIKRLAGSR